MRKKKKRRQAKPAESPVVSAASRVDPPRPIDKAERQALFLEAFGKVGNIRTAAEAVNMNRSTHYEWMDEEGSGYPRLFAIAEDEFRDLIRETVRLRAILGTPQEIYFQGKFLGFRHELSDRLLELLAKAKCPEFKDKHEITGAGGGAVKFEVVTGVPQPEGE